MASLPKRILELDGFRGIAVLMVMTEHTYEAAPSAVHIPSPLYFLLTHGWLGVDLFFVLSGFLITGILLDERKRRDYLQSFYRRRACRILPLAFTCLLLLALIHRAFGLDFVLTALFCANLNILFGVLPIPGTGAMWSLAVEEHFYLLWPLAIRRLPRIAIGVIAVAIILLSPVARGVAMHYGVHPLSVYQLSWFRFDGLAMGALLAILVRTRHFTVRNTWLAASGWLTAIVLVTAILKPYGVFEPKSILGEAFRYTQAQALFGTAMAVALVHQGSRGTRFLRGRFLGWTASLSYCLYLIHMPIADACCFTMRHFSLGNSLALRYAAIFAVSFALASLSGKYLERPFLRRRQFSSLQNSQPSAVRS